MFNYLYIISLLMLNKLVSIFTKSHYSTTLNRSTSIDKHRSNILDNPQTQSRWCGLFAVPSKKRPIRKALRSKGLSP